MSPLDSAVVPTLTNWIAFFRPRRPARGEAAAGEKMLPQLPVQTLAYAKSTGPGGSGREAPSRHPRKLVLENPRDLVFPILTGFGDGIAGEQETPT